MIKQFISLFCRVNHSDTLSQRHSRNALGILIAALVASLPSLHASDFDTGLQAYENSNYTEAVDAFKRSLQTEESAAAYHNLGLSLYQLAEPANAVWQLERAARLEPLNDNYLYKLGALRRELGLYEMPSEWWLLASRTLSQGTWTWLASICIWVPLLGMIIPRMGGFKRPILLKLTMFLSTAIALTAVSAIAVLVTQEASGLVISKEPIELHYAPASAAPEAGLARPGERARLLDAHGDYLKIETEAKVAGWIHTENFLEF